MNGQNHSMTSVAGRKENRKQSMVENMKKTVQLLQEFSFPLIIGVFAALLVANVAPHTYHTLVHTPIHQIWGELGHDGEAADQHSEASEHGDEPSEHGVESAEHGDESAQDGDEHAAGHHGWEHYFTMHFLVNDLFMVLFFGIAAKEITEACLPGGALNPMKKAINPLLGTLGGVFGPVGVFFLLNALFGDPTWSRGWGIPTATDIALAWLVARFVFGAGHPAVSFLLLLAVADDAIGLGIIAIAYPNPNLPTEWLNSWWILPGMGVAFGLRLAKVQSWIPYIACGGALSWWGLYSAHLHPALALVFIVPFLPGPRRDVGIFVEEADYDAVEAEAQSKGHDVHSPLEDFEHNLKTFVDWGLFFFAFANAGVPFSGITGLTWIIFLSLAIGKTIGITAFSWAGVKIGFPLPTGMGLKQLVLAGVVAGLGLTVALFVAGQAYVDGGLQGAAKMGALFSGAIGIIAIVLGKVLRVRETPEASDSTSGAE
jgi:Na+:H+ antiporter, NhaA family